MTSHQTVPAPNHYITVLVWTLLTLQVDEEGAVAQQGVRGQVAGQRAGQVDPCYHHQLSQLRGGGGGLLLERLKVKWGGVCIYTVPLNRL